MRHRESVQAYFRLNTRDLTPESLEDQVRILYLPFSGHSDITRQCLGVLSSRERERIGRFTAPVHRESFIERRAFRRYCSAVALNSQLPLSAFDLVETENGRPWLAGQPQVWFSFSSCRSGFLGAWSSTHDVGIDVEDTTQDRGVVDLAQAYFSAAEACVVAGADNRKATQDFFRFWCLKEAALKSIGQGLPYGLDRFEFELEPRPRAVHTPVEFGKPGRYRISVMESSDRCIALVLRKRDH